MPAWPRSVYTVDSSTRPGEPTAQPDLETGDLLIPASDPYNPLRPKPRTASSSAIAA
jgi:hypothetical protein